MKIGYISINDPTNRRAWSGIKASMFNILSKIHHVEWVGPINSELLRFRYYWKSEVMKWILQKKLDWFHSVSFSKALSKKLHKKLENAYDMLFAPGASTEIAFLDTRIPIVYLSGTTFGAMLEYYESFQNLSTRSIKEGHIIEKNALERAKTAIFASSWARDSAQQIYDIPPEKLHIVHYGPNLESIPDKNMLVYKSREHIRLLYVGLDWKRKGGDIALEIFKKLKSMGNKVQFTIIGSHQKDILEPGIRIIPYLNKKDAEGLKTLCDLYTNSDFFLLPTRAECAGVVFSEASAFGLPIITTNTGGVSDYVVNGVNGYCLPPEASVDDYASLIHNLFRDKSQLVNLRTTTRKHYEKELNWNTWLHKIDTIFHNKL